jgi:hypothetical protein
VNTCKNFNKEEISDWLKDGIHVLEVVRSANASSEVSSAAGFEPCVEILYETERFLDYMQSAEYGDFDYTEEDYTIHPGSKDEMLREALHEEASLLRSNLLVAELSEEVRKQTLAESLSEISLPADTVAPYALYAMRFDPISFTSISKYTYPRLLRQFILVPAKASDCLGGLPLHGVLRAPTWLPQWLHVHRLLNIDTPEPYRSRTLQEVDPEVVSASETDLLRIAIDIWDPLGPLIWARDFNDTVRTCRKIWQAR